MKQLLGLLLILIFLSCGGGTTSETENVIFPVFEGDSTLVEVAVQNKASAGDLSVLSIPKNGNQFELGNLEDGEYQLTFKDVDGTLHLFELQVENGHAIQDLSLARIVSENQEDYRNVVLVIQDSLLNKDYTLSLNGSPFNIKGNSPRLTVRLPVGVNYYYVLVLPDGTPYISGLFEISQNTDVVALYFEKLEGSKSLQDMEKLGLDLQLDALGLDLQWMDKDTIFLKLDTFDLGYSIPANVFKTQVNWTVINEMNASGMVWLLSSQTGEKFFPFNFYERGEKGIQFEYSFYPGINLLFGIKQDIRQIAPFTYTKFVDVCLDFTVKSTAEYLTVQIFETDYSNPIIPDYMTSYPLTGTEQSFSYCHAEVRKAINPSDDSLIEAFKTIRFFFPSGFAKVEFSKLQMRWIVNRFE